jgi:alpha-galactosidase
MEGHAEVASLNRTSGGYLNGTLAYQVTDPRTSGMFSRLWDNSTQSWVVLPNVKVWYNENGTEQGINGSTIPSQPGEAAFGDLTVGFGTGADLNLIGPEYGFGFGRSDHFPGEKILIMKTAWGGKTLAGDFRPPSSVTGAARGEDPFCQVSAGCVNEVGHYYSVMVADAHKMLTQGAASSMFPDLDGLAPVLGGFGWFQGWNDGCDLNQTAAYEYNMVNLIKDLRTEFDNPKLPVSIAVAGFDGFSGEDATRTPRSDIPWVDMDPTDKLGTNCANDRGCRRLDIILSQLAAGNATRHPELNGHVASMETRQFWRDPQYSPNSAEGYHYWHNAETCYLVGRALAEGMVSATLQ